MIELLPNLPDHIVGISASGAGYQQRRDKKVRSLAAVQVLLLGLFCQLRVRRLRFHLVRSFALF
jgi:hypothetical protein